MFEDGSLIYFFGGVRVFLAFLCFFFFASLFLFSFFFIFFL